MQEEKIYDAIVIGAGMGGLTAAAYLAQAGKKVALFEHHRQLGGCCTSFHRKGFVFDAAVHAIGSCEPDGMFRKLLEELGIWERLHFYRSDPMDVIATPEWEVPIWAEHERFIAALRDVFPHEIDRLVKMVDAIRNFGPDMYGQWGGATYRQFLDHYIQDDGARIVFMAPLGNIGLPSYRIGAINGCTLFRENQLGGGYYPQGGFQVLADAFGQRIEELGGEIHRRTEVTRLEIKDGLVEAVHVRHVKGEERRIPCRTVISNAAAIDTMERLVGTAHIPADYLSRIHAMEPSLSSGVLFLGLSRDIAADIKYHSIYWYIHAIDSKMVDDCFDASAIERTMFDKKGSIYVAFQSLQDPASAPLGKSTLVAISPAVYKEPPFWKARKPELEEAMICRAEQLVPWLRDCIEWREAATSATVERYTRNTAGAWYGWASTPEQSNLRRLERVTPLPNLWLAGHWTQPGPGVVQVSKSGQITARAVLRALKKIT